MANLRAAPVQPLVIVHEQLSDYGGAERVLEGISDNFPSAPIFGLAFERQVHPRLAVLPNPLFVEATSAQRNPYRFDEWSRRTSVWQLPRARLILAMVQSGWSLALTRQGEAAFVAYATGVSRPYVWDSDAYIAALATSERPAARDSLVAIRVRYRQLLRRPDEVWAPSSWSARYLQDYSGRSVSTVSPDPPCAQVPCGKGRRRGFIVVSRLVRHKDLDVVIEAFRGLDEPLTILGEGPDSHRLVELSGPQVTFEGFVSDRTKDQLIGEARALICPSVEEFGLSMVEGLAAGVPVIAPNQGAAREIVPPNAGVLIDPPITSLKLATVVQTFDDRRFRQSACREAAAQATCSPSISDAIRLIVQALDS